MHSKLLTFLASFLRKQLAPGVVPMNVMHVSRRAILGNYRYLRELQSSASLFPVVKSNAYGHGLEEIVSLFEETDAAMIAVDSFPEYQVVHARSSKDILLMSETLPMNYKFFDLERTHFCISNIQTLLELVRLQKEIKIHIFLNTGMNREGANESGLLGMLSVFRSNPQLHLEGVCSHFASADEADDSVMQSQIERFKQMYEQIESAGFAPSYRHIGASSGLLKMDDPFFNAFRPGIVLYGINPLEPSDPHYQKGIPLEPAMRVTTRITGFQDLRAGDGVGYNHAFVATQAMRIATIPFGYFEWLSRKLGNQISFYWQKNEIPQRWKICMNISMVDTMGYDMQIGERIEVVSQDRLAPNSIESMARTIGTIPYEVLVKFPESIHREIVD